MRLYFKNRSKVICYISIIPFKGIVLLPFDSFALFSWFGVFETASCYVVQDELSSMFLLPLPPEHWDCRCSLPLPAWGYLVFNVSLIQGVFRHHGAMFSFFSCFQCFSSFDHWDRLSIFMEGQKETSFVNNVGSSATFWANFKDHTVQFLAGMRES